MWGRYNKGKQYFLCYTDEEKLTLCQAENPEKKFSSPKMKVTN